MSEVGTEAKYTDRRGLAEALIIAENEELILLNRRADRAAKLIAAELEFPGANVGRASTLDSGGSRKRCHEFHWCRT